MDYIERLLKENGEKFLNLMNKNKIMPYNYFDELNLTQNEINEILKEFCKLELIEQAKPKSVYRITLKGENVCKNGFNKYYKQILKENNRENRKQTLLTSTAIFQNIIEPIISILALCLAIYSAFFK